MRTTHLFLPIETCSHQIAEISPVYSSLPGPLLAVDYLTSRIGFGSRGIPLFSGCDLEVVAMDLKYSKCARAEQELKWAKIWARKLGDFHQRQRQFDWAFSADDVIAFLRSKRDAGGSGVEADEDHRGADSILHGFTKTQRR